MHVPNEKRKKLDNKGETCVFLGITKESKAYKLFNPLMKKIVIGKDIIFYEENTWNWNEQQPTQVIFDNDSEEENQQSLQQQISVVSKPSNEALITTETSSITVESTNVLAKSRLRRG